MTPVDKAKKLLEQLRLKKGEALDKAPKGTNGEYDPLYEWQRDGTEEGRKHRDAIPRMSGSERKASLKALARKTKVRLANDGGREFLLHRGEGNSPIRSESGGRVNHSVRTSWSPSSKLGSFLEPGGGRTSAWVHENKIIYHNPSPKVFSDEHEVIVEPNHSSEIESFESYGDFWRKNPMFGKSDSSPTIKKAEEVLNQLQKSKWSYSGKNKQDEIPEKMNGWISPTGKHHNLPIGGDHAEWILSNYGKSFGVDYPKDSDGEEIADAMDSAHEKAINAGWIAVGHGESNSITASHNVIGNPKHPANQTLQRLMKEHAIAPKFEVSVWKGKSASLVDLDTEHFIKHGRIKASSTIKKAEEVLEDMRKGKRSGFSLKAHDFKPMTSTHAGIYRIKNNQPDEKGYFSVEAYLGNSEVGSVTMRHMGSHIRPISEEESHESGGEGVNVNKDFRRQGIATAMYTHAEKASGKKLKPSHDQTSDAKALWNQPNRPFGKSESVPHFVHPHLYEWHDGHTSHHSKLNKSEPLAKEQWTQVQYNRKLNPLHGWISPSGEYHHMEPSETHSNKIGTLTAKEHFETTGEYGGLREADAIDRGWIKVSPAGSAVIAGNHKVLADKNHPATKTLKNKIREALNTEEGQHHWGSYFQLSHDGVDLNQPPVVRRNARGMQFSSERLATDPWLKHHAYMDPFEDIGKSETSHPHNDAHGPAVNDQAGGNESGHFHKIMGKYGTITPGKTTNLKFYSNLEHLEPKIHSMLAKKGYQYYIAGGKYGKPDLANKNYNTRHLMIYDPTPQSGGDFGDEGFTRAWRLTHELAHAETYKDLNAKYGEGRRLGKLGVRTPHEGERAIVWEHLATHKQRDLMASMGYHMSDEDFAKEYNTVMGDAVHRAVTGQFTDPAEMGFEPHNKKIPLEHTISLFNQYVKQLGLRHAHDTLAKLREDSKK
jgi:hypothetical protein